jgi:peptidoglycan/LPS O-acetylase OafA/YrhL
MAQNERIPLLDSYRVVAAFSVLGFHYWGKPLEDLRLNLVLGRIFDFPHLDQIFRFGHMGVDLFYLISGFVIALSAEGRSFAAFTSSRLARIVPTYWLAVTLTTLFILFEGTGYREIGVRQFLVNLVFLQRPLGEQFIDGVYSTIVMEMRFYLLVAALLALGRFRFYPYLLPAWVVLSLLEYLNIPLGPLKQIFITNVGYYFAAGSAFYLLYRRRHVRLAVGTILLSLIVALPKAIEHDVSSYGSAAAIPVAVVTLACYGLMALVATRKFEDMRWPWLPILAGMTYPLYLIHEDIGFILMRHMVFIGDGFSITLVVTAFVAIVAWLIHARFERIAVPAVRRWLAASFYALGFADRLAQATERF